MSESDEEDNQNDSGDLQILSYHDSNPAETQPFETEESQDNPFVPFPSQGSISYLYGYTGIVWYNLYPNICVIYGKIFQKKDMKMKMKMVIKSSWLHQVQARSSPERIRSEVIIQKSPKSQSMMMM